MGVKVGFWNNGIIGFRIWEFKVGLMVLWGLGYGSLRWVVWNEEGLGIMALYV